MCFSCAGTVSRETLHCLLALPVNERFSRVEHLNLYKHEYRSMSLTAG